LPQKNRSIIKDDEPTIFDNDVMQLQNKEEKREVKDQNLVQTENVPNIKSKEEEKKGNYILNRSTSVQIHENNMEFQVKTTQNYKDPNELEENKVFYDKFPEISKRIINIAIENAKKEGRRDNKLLSKIIENAIYREYSLDLADKHNEKLESKLKAQKAESLNFRRRGYSRRGRRIHYREEREEVDDSIQKDSNDNPQEKLKIHWAINNIKATHIYDQEEPKNKNVLMSYHITKCEQQIIIGHKPEKCLFFHENEDERRRPLYLDGGINK